MKEVELVDGDEVALSEDDLEDIYSSEIEGSGTEDISGMLAQFNTFQISSVVRSTVDCN